MDIKVTLWDAIEELSDMTSLTLPQIGARLDRWLRHHVEQLSQEDYANLADAAMDMQEYRGGKAEYALYDPRTDDHSAMGWVLRCRGKLGDVEYESDLDDRYAAAGPGFHLLVEGGELP